MFDRLLRWCTIYTFSGLLPRNGILPRAKFTLRQSLAFSYIGSVTARHSSSGHQPNFAELSRGHHPYSARRPSCWASAHILVFINVTPCLQKCQYLFCYGFDVLKSILIIFDRSQAVYIQHTNRMIINLFTFTWKRCIFLLLYFTA